MPIYTISEESMLVPQILVYGAWNVKPPTLLDVGACVRWLETVMSTIKVVNYQIHNDSQSIRSSMADKTLLVQPFTLSPLCVGPIPQGPITHFEYSRMGHFFYSQ